MRDMIEVPLHRVVPTSTTRCRACGGDATAPFASSPSVPVNDARVFESRDEARHVPTGAIELVHCTTCGFVQNARFRPELVRYETSCEERQSYSPTFAAFSDGLAADLVARWDLHGKRVVEIGCGKGDFLAAVCELGGNTGIGIDPTAVPGRLERGADRVLLRRALYDESTGPLEADAVICRHTLEHLAGVAAFVRTLRRSLLASPHARVFIEVPDVMRVLRDGAFWDVYYEHCSYFSPGSLARLFRANGFVVDDVRLAFENQYVLLEARPAADEVGPRPGPCPAEDSPGDVAEAATIFGRRVEADVRGWAARVERVRERGGRVAIWGSGSKCVAFLSETGIGIGIDAVVDVNPFRQGRFLPATGVQVLPPAALARLRPELVVVMNAAYLSEIGVALAAMDVRPRLEAVG
jgi:SAM-dependent methyltransferase